MSKSASIAAKSLGGAGAGTGGAETVPVEVTEGVTAWPAETGTGSGGGGGATPGGEGGGGGGVKAINPFGTVTLLV